MTASSSPSSPPGLRALAGFPAEVQAAHARFRKHGDVEAADRVLLAILQDHLPDGSPARRAGALPDDSRLIEDLGLDSLTIAEVVFFVEDVYQVRIPQKELQRLTRVGDLRRYLRARLQSPAA